MQDDSRFRRTTATRYPRSNSSLCLLNGPWPRSFAGQFDQAQGRQASSVRARRFDMMIFSITFFFFYYRHETLEPLYGPDNAPSTLPWVTWELDKNFFQALSRWTLDHPETSLDRILERICVGIDSGQDLIALIPDQPFPARGLVTAVVHLFKLSVVRSYLFDASRGYSHLPLKSYRLLRAPR